MKAAEAKTASPARKGTSSSKDSGGDFFAPDVQERPFFPRSNVNRAIQRRVTVGPANDPYEREADAMAGTVVQKLGKGNVGEQGNGLSVQKKTNGSVTSGVLVQNKCATCEQEEKLQKKEDAEGAAESLQRKPIFESNAEPPEDDKHVQRCE